MNEFVSNTVATCTMTCNNIEKAEAEVIQLVQLLPFHECYNSTLSLITIPVRIVDYTLFRLTI